MRCAMSIRRRSRPPTVREGLVIELDVEPPATAHVAWTGSRTLRDGDEAGAYHVAVSVTAVTAA